MYSVWTNHLEDPLEKEQFKQSLKNSKWALDHLKSLLEKMDRNKAQAEISPRVYDQPNWGVRQAHSNGYRQCLREVQLLLNLDHKEIDDPR